MSVRRVVAVATYPLLVLGAVAVVAVGQRAGWPASLVLAGTVGGAALLVALLERAFAYRAAWARAQGDTFTDAGLTLTSLVTGDTVARGLVAGAVPLVARFSGGAAGVWPTDWPLAAQLVLALLVSELGGYWSHRWMHRHPWLWRLHAVHHSAPRLYWLNATRNHPGDVLLSTAATMGPLVVLGAGEAVLGLFTAFVSVHLMLQHANLDTRLGPLNWVLSTGEVHRWHHSRRLEEADANYGNVLLVWDVVFGTRLRPEGREPPEDVGLHGAPAFPSTLWGQLLAPVRRGLWTR